MMMQYASLQYQNYRSEPSLWGGVKESIFEGPLGGAGAMGGHGLWVHVF